MANYSELLNDINAAIYENNDQEIDALEVRAILREMVTSLGSGFLFKGIATPSSPSGTGTYEPDQNVFYLATTAGTYTYLGGLVVAAGEVAFLCFDGTWTKKSSALLSTGSIVDNTTTEDATKPLSAKQGKVLADAGAATAAEVSALGQKVDGGEVAIDITNSFAFVSNGGFYIDQTLGVNFTGELLYFTGGDYAPAVDVSQYAKIVVVDGGSSGNRAVILTDASNKVVFSGKWGDHTSDHTMTINVASLGGKYLYISKGTGISCVVTAYTNVVGLMDRMDAAEQAIAELDEDVNGSEAALAITESSGKMYLADASLIDNASSYYADVDLSQYEGMTIIITMSNIYSQSERYTGLAVNGSFVVSFAEKYYTGPVSWVIPANAHLYISHHNTSSASATIEQKGLKEELLATAEKVVFVAKTGDDDNDGTAGAPFLTIQKAINANASRIMVGGGTYDEALDLGSFGRKRLEIMKSELFKEVIIQAAPTTIASSGESLVSGYTSVYKLTGVSGIPADISTLVQIGKPYGTISAEERRPEQMGKAYRLDDTPIRKVSSSISTASAACAEIERAYTEDGVFEFYLDGTDLYFARPGALSSSYPLVRATAKKSLFNNVPDNMTFVISGIRTRFLVFNVVRSQNSIITDCKSEFAYGAGAFSYDGSTGIIFRRCEAAACSDGSTGDGFNGHVDNLTGYSAGDKFAKCCTCTMEYCWSHDNHDDGYSDHQRAETTIVGGLFEYNGKGGIVPSYGSHCVCIDVESRHNCNGFFCCGTPDATEGGVGTQLKCYNCVATDNTNQYGQNTDNAGFYSVNDKCLLIAYNCFSAGNKIGYLARAEGSGGGANVLIDCRALNNSTSDWYPKSLPALTTIYNGAGISY